MKNISKFICFKFFSIKFSFYYGFFFLFLSFVSRRARIISFPPVSVGSSWISWLIVFSDIQTASFGVTVNTKNTEITKNGNKPEVKSP